MADIDKALPSLAFGERGAKVDSDVQAYGDRMRQVVTSLQFYDAIGPKRNYRQKSAVAMINGLRLVSGVCTAVQTGIAASADLTLMVPFSGVCTTTIGRRSLEWRAGEDALFLPGIARGGHCTMRSTLFLDLRQERLQQTARVMLGLDPSAIVDFRLFQERKISLHANGMDFSAVMLKLCGVLDEMGERTSATLALDDQFYRLAALMLHPGLLDNEVLRRVDARSSCIVSVQPPHLEGRAAA